eukprot:365993-Chlamydomonas_euryale.AAC.4
MEKQTVRVTGSTVTRMTANRERQRMGGGGARPRPAFAWPIAAPRRRCHANDTQPMPAAT